MNHVRPIDTNFRDDHYPHVRLALALRIVKCRPKVFVENRRRCQDVLDTIDQLFLAKG